MIGKILDWIGKLCVVSMWCCGVVLLFCKDMTGMVLISLASIWMVDTKLDKITKALNKC